MGKQRFCTSERSKNEPRWFQNGSMTTPRSPKIALEPVLAALGRSWVSLGRSCAALWPLLAALGPSCEAEAALGARGRGAGGSQIPTSYTSRMWSEGSDFYLIE